MLYSELDKASLPASRLPTHIEAVTRTQSPAHGAPELMQHTAYRSQIGTAGFTFFATLSVLAFSALAPTPAHAQDTPDFRAEFQGQFEASARKLVALSEAMPAESYSWSPMEGVMSVSRVYMHIARYNYMYPDLNLGIEAPKGVDYRSFEEGMSGKDKVVPILAASMDHVRAVVDGMSDDDLAAPVELYGRQVASWAVLLQLVTHMNEHLGQSIAYARMNRIVPPWSR